MNLMKKVTFTMGALALSATVAQAEDFILTVGAGAPPVVPPVKAITDASMPIIAEAATANGGSVEYITGFGGSLYNIMNTLEGVRDGLADFGWVGANWEPDNMPLHQVITALPFVNNNPAIGQKIDLALQATPAFEDEWSKNGLTYLGATAGDPYVIVSKEPIESVADMKGLKIYAPGAIATWLEGTGAATLDGNLPAMVNGLQTGVADAALVPLGGVFIFKFHEFAPNVMFPGLGTSAMNGGLAINTDVYNDLPDYMKDAFHKAGEAYTGATLAMGNGMSGMAMKAFEAADVNIVRLSREEREKWASAMPNVGQQWLERVNALGLDGDAVLNAFMEAAEAEGADIIRDWRTE